MDVLGLMKSRMGDDKTKEKKRPQKRKFIEISLTGDDETLVVDFQEKVSQKTSQETSQPTFDVAPEVRSGKSISKDFYEAGGDANRITGVIRNIERMYTGELEYLDGYDMEDSFIDKSDAFTKESYRPKPQKKRNIADFS